MYWLLSFMSRRYTMLNLLGVFRSYCWHPKRS
nr:MAG TPA: hypothetical protein [Caudoviricetes sp.]